MEIALETPDVPSGNTTTESPNTATPEKFPDELRRWFVNLSVEDRAAALGFVDDTFLHSISRAVSSLSTCPGGGKPTADELYRRDGFDWEAPILSEDLERILGISIAVHDSSVGQMAAEAGNQEEAAEPVTEETLSAVPDPEETSPEGEEDEDIPRMCEDIPSVVASEIVEEDREEAADEFRIRTTDMDETEEATILDDAHEESKNGEIATEENGLEESKIDLSQSKEILPIVSEPKKKDQLAIFNHVSTVSPSVLHMIQPSIVFEEEVQPLIAMHPSYLCSVRGEDLLLAFDDLMLTRSFLSGPAYEFWGDAVQYLASNPALQSQIPLYMLLLARFEISIFDTYRRSLHTPATVNKPTHAPSECSTQHNVSEQNEVTDKLVPETQRVPAQPCENETSSAMIQEVESQDVSAGPNESSEEEEAIMIETDSEVASKDRAPSCDESLLLALLPRLLEKLEDKDDSSLEVDEIFVPVTNYFGLILEGTDGVKTGVTADDSTMPDKAVEQSLKVTEASLDESVDSSNVVISSTENPEQNGVLGLESVAEASIDDVVQALEAASAAQSSGKKNSKRRKKKKKRKAVSSTSDTSNNQHEKAIESKMIENSLNPKGTEQHEQTPKELQHHEDETLPEPSESASLEMVVESGTIEQSVSVENGDNDTSIEEATTVSRTESAEIEKDTEILEHKSADETNDGLHVSRVNGVGTVVVTPSITEESKPPTDQNIGASAVEKPDAVLEEDDQDEWETVEVRSRNNRKKSGDRGNHGRFSQNYNGNGNNGSKKKAPRNSESRKRNLKRKMVREILSSVLDAVDEQVRRRTQVSSDPPRRPAPNAWAVASSKKKPLANGSADIQKLSIQKDGATMRDILVGKQTMKGSVSTQSLQRSHPDRARQRGGGTEASKKNRDKVPIGSPTADQNTAPTVPETLSAVSTASAFTETPSMKNLQPRSELARSESSSDGSIEATKHRSNSKQAGKEASPAPPLPTLLSPGNANSATSSVASSLDAPHAVHHNHLSSHPGNENDVGYHLLHVCERLTRDIGQFMKRREQALTIRHRERRLVLGALQDTLSSIWPGLCSVEPYGSCATDLDLPSSDLDVVIRGLDSADQTLHTTGSMQSEGNSRIDHNDAETKMGSGGNNGISSPVADVQHAPMQRGLPQHQFATPYGHTSPNAERVVRLAMELERQPWAVQVKAIPTATVPVIKILADPARLQGTMSSGSGDWLVQHSMVDQSTPVSSSATSDPSDPRSMYNGNQTQFPWRGADVVNGLLKLDITFEGPEHGGIGSTLFSKRVVQEFSAESKLPADATPAVQVLMVLKELLAQRRLNEPFSGGLSSYALLLLVISMIGERSIIRKELERVERQRRLVAAGGGNAIPRPITTEAYSQVAKGTNLVPKLQEMKSAQLSVQSQDGRQQRNGKLLQGDETTGRKKEEQDVLGKPIISGTKGSASSQEPATLVGDGKSIGGSGRQDGGTEKRVEAPSSSWASIARKNPVPRKSNQESAPSNTTEKKTPVPKKVSTFADAVANGAPAVSTSSMGKSLDGSKARAKGAEPKGRSVQSSEMESVRGKENGTIPSSGVEVQLNNKGAAIPGLESKTQLVAEPAVASKQNASAVTDDSGSSFPQGFHDVIEVLCSGETTAGKLLMHFLLFYGQHFDSHSVAIDYSGTHERDSNANCGYSTSSAYMQRRNNGSYDPMTGMLTVDPIMIYDPLEGAENNNVARSCFAWSSIRWVFAQSYMTLSSAVEMSAGHSSEQARKRSPSSSASQGTRISGVKNSAGQHDTTPGLGFSHDESGNVIFDPSSPLLELILSF